MSFTSTGFNPTLQTCNAFDHAFPVEVKGWGVTHWDCDLIWDDEFKTSSARIRRHADMNLYNSNEKVREGIEVEVVLNKPDATREELETAMLRACRDFDPDHCLKNPYIGHGDKEDEIYLGTHFTIVWPNSQK